MIYDIKIISQKTIKRTRRYTNNSGLRTKSSNHQGALYKQVYPKL